MIRLPDNHHSDATRVYDPHGGYMPGDHRETQNIHDSVNLPLETAIAQKLSTAKEYAQMGQLPYAYRLSREATIAAPGNVDAWLLRGAFAESNEECLACISRAIMLAPQHSVAKHSMYNALRRYLDQNPFLRYIDETDLLYRVLNREGRAIVIPKDRTVSAAYPPTESTPLQPVFRWLTFSALGLLLAGFGAVACAPIAGAKAWRLSQQSLNVHDRRQARMALLFASILFVTGLLLSFIFLIHL